ncbi:MAG: 30S ribosomal protein S4, partial [Spirochaetes bacterium]|nr:30S ribosomal protein S4 [Spirochaetota bacterium]
CRREGMKLMLKGDRCLSSKCSITKHKLPPGQLPRRRRKVSEYGMQLREKQKVKRYYGLFEKQFKRYFEIASRRKGVTGEILLVLLEQRLDNVVCRLHFATSRAMARQLVRHGHILVNGRKVDIPSYFVREGDEIEVKQQSKKLIPVLESMKNESRVGTVPWLEVNPDDLKGKLLYLPKREEIDLPVNEQLIVELYSK